MIPLYIDLYKKGELKKRIDEAWALLKSCVLCPRNCKVNRLIDEKGLCNTGKRVVVSSYGPHFGEESPLVGKRGSGTIFITWCCMRCIYCQNYSISQLGEGTETSNEDLAKMMLSLQNQGCHNINIVTPTHVVPQILSALEIAVGKGLNIPLVYNTGGYDSAETLKILNGIFDIYMPDMKYGDRTTAAKLSKISNYPKINQDAVLEMHRQVGDLVLDGNGIAQRGLLIRHLVLPDNLAGTEKVLEFIAKKISKNTYLNIMDQYNPHHKAFKKPPLNKRIISNEYNYALKLAKKYGLNRLDSKKPISFIRIF
ncbi:MAG: radical SAM protein [Actinobacteria bacterium]|nr:radical SAM protein [Actinomycetota bacterium]